MEQKELYQITLETQDGAKQVPCGRDESILDAALRSGVDMPWTCHQGRCLTCAGVLLENGDVDQTSADTYFPEDRAAGFLLLCRAYPRSDLRVRTHQAGEMRTHRINHGLPAPNS